MRLTDIDPILELFKKWRTQLTPPNNDIRDDGAFEGVDCCIAELEKAPTIDAEPVVRCGECEHFDELKGKDSGKPIGYGLCKFPAGMSGIVFTDSFCSYGERRYSDG